MRELERELKREREREIKTEIHREAKAKGENNLVISKIRALTIWFEL